MADLRFAIVGLGKGMGKARSCAETAGASLAAVCDLWDERGEKAQAELGVDWVKDYQELLGRSDVDVIGLWTPSGGRCAMALQALEAGKHVCMTKPMDLETAMCRKAADRASQKGLVLALDFESRYRPVAHRVRSVLQSGALGDLVLVDLRMKWYRTQGYYDGGMPAGWRSRLETERGSLANQAVHFLDLLQWWLGPVSRLVGKRSTRGHRIETEDTAIAMMEFTSGPLASLATTTCSFPNIGTTMEFTGSDGTLTWTDNEVSRLQIAEVLSRSGTAGGGYGADFAVDREAADRAIEEFPAPGDLPADIIADVVRAVERGTPVQCDGREGTKSVALFETIYASSDQDLWLTPSA